MYISMYINILDGDSMDQVEMRMSKKVITVKKNQTVSSAAKLMDKYNISSLIVVEKGVPEGIITERDVLKKIVAKDKDPAKVKVKDIVTMKVVTIDAGDSISQASNLMALGKIKQLPVMKNGKLVGIITSTDIVRAIRLMREDLLNI